MKINKYRLYEEEKKKLLEVESSSEELEKALKALAKKLKI